MKIAIIGDVHFEAGYKSGKVIPQYGLNSRLIDYINTLSATIDAIVELGCEEIIFTGDMFENKHPTPKALEVLAELLRYALDKGIKKIHIVIGNHDQQRLKSTTTLGYLKKLALDEIEVHDEITYKTFHWAGKPVANLFFMPYRDRFWYGVDTHQEAIEEVQKHLDECLEQIENTLPNILIGHMAIEGTFFDDDYRDLTSENQLLLPRKMFERMNVTLMGHVHKPEILSQKPYIAYVGSMEKRGAFEDHDKVFAVVDLEKATVEYHKEPCRELYEFTIDYSTITLGADLMTSVYQDIDSFAEKNSLKGSILKGEVKISAADEQYFDSKSLYNYVKETYKPQICHDIKQRIYGARQSRDERINEDVSEEEALRLFLENTVDDPTLRSSLLEHGVEIMRLEGGK